MAELKRVWVVRDAEPSNLDDPALPTEADILYQFVETEGMDMVRFIHLVNGTGSGTWFRENTKVYTDLASAKKDAKQRLAQLRKRYKRASEEAVVDRFLQEAG